MMRYWELARSKIDGLTLRERAIMFLVVAFLMFTLANTFLFDPLLLKERALAAQLQQQQERMKELEAQMQAQLQARRDDDDSPLRPQLLQLEQQLQEQESYLQSRREQLIEPDRMAELLKQVLNQNGKLQLVELKTLPVSSLVSATPQPAGADSSVVQKQIFKHGIQITVRGGYLDMLRYLAMLEKMPVQMYWGEISFSVEKYPDAVLTLTMYTLSLDKTWLTV